MFFCNVNILESLSVFFNIAKAIFKLAGRIEKACTGANKIVRAKDSNVQVD